MPCGFNDLVARSDAAWQAVSLPGMDKVSFALLRPWASTVFGIVQAAASHCTAERVARRKSFCEDKRSSAVVEYGGGSHGGRKDG